jgi:hypothetical protein
MRRFVDQMPAIHQDNLVDSVGELIAAVFDVDACGSMRDKAPIDIGISRHAAVGSSPVRDVDLAARRRPQSSDDRSVDAIPSARNLR